MGKASDWLREERRKTLGDWVSFCLACGHAQRYFEELEADPYPIYAALRERSPVAYMPCLDVWMVTSWATVEAACTNPDAFPAHVANSPTNRALGGISMMSTDGEPARRRRRPFDATLRPRAVEATMAAVFERLCRERLDSFAPSEKAFLADAHFIPRRQALNV